MQHLKSSNLVAIGHDTQEDAARFLTSGLPHPTSVRPAFWNENRRFNDKKHELFADGKLVMHGVRFVPLLLAPSAPEMLDGRRLADVFSQFILGDPETQNAILRSGKDGGLGIHRLTSWNIRSDTQASLETDISGGSKADRPIIPASVQMVISDRLRSLVDLVASGKVKVEGKDAKGKKVVLSFDIWNGEDITIDLEASTLKRSCRGKLEPFASSITLVRGTAAARPTAVAHPFLPAWDDERDTHKIYIRKWVAGRPPHDRSFEREVEQLGDTAIERHRCIASFAGRPSRAVNGLGKELTDVLNTRKQMREEVSRVKPLRAS
ncbi:hypothetical protein [Aestuariivirga sp.]|uniref:hypothetical protein n=1 Tax=Aestuariivirga sp. TaxID=2650926 RepID=UPI0039E6A0DB